MVFDRPEWGILALAIVLRVAGGMLTVKPQTGGDAREYVLLGHNLASGNGFSLSADAPFVATDWRMPGYPAVLAVNDWLDLGDTGLVLFNSLLGAVAVAAIVLIARQVFPGRPRLRIALGLAAAMYPPLITYTGVAYAENLSIAAVCWFTYVAFFAPFDRDRAWWWLFGWFVAGSVVFATRAEGLLLVTVTLLATVLLKRISWRLAAVLILLSAIAPTAWAIRNEVDTGRFETVDSLNRDATLVLSVEDGQFTSPIYQRGVHLAVIASPDRERDAYHDAVIDRVEDSLRDDTGHVLSYKAKSLLNFTFTPLVWIWSAEDDYVLSDAVANLNGRNALRVFWSGILLLQYGFALIGLLAWWREGKRAYVVGIAMYPILALLLAIPFHSELRLWMPAAFLLLVPAVNGAATVAAWRGERKLSQ